MLAAGTALGPYTILAPLGAGGMGEVYTARDPRLNRTVAIKVVRTDVARDPERRHRFDREARAAGALNHPNVCTIYDVGVHDDAPFVVMELLEGESLRAALRAGPLPLPQVMEYAAQAARGVAAAHAAGIVHRDLKPENLFVTRDGRVKVLDFGLAKLTRPDAVWAEGDPTISVAETESGAILGTAGYMAPEQLRGREVDARADVFALGAVVHEMVSGQPAFRRGSFVETAYAILNTEPPSLSSLRTDVPPGLESLVRRCLEKEPGRRFQSAHDLALDLESLASGRASAVAGRSAGRRRGLSRTRAALAAVVVVAALAATARWQHWWPFGGVTATPPEKKDWILVAEFEAPPADSLVALAARGLLSAALDQSRIVQTVPREFVRNALKAAGKPENTRVDAEVARELAYRSAVRAVLEGSIGRLGKGYSIVLSVVDADTSRVLLTRSATAKDDDALIPAIGELAKQLRRGLGENQQALKATRSMGLVMTPSFEAYKLYAQVWSVYRRRTSNRQAVAGLRAALAIDPDFASAWSGMAMLYYNLGYPDSQRVCIEEALRRPDRLTAGERRALARASLEATGDFAGQAAAYDQWVADDPANPSALGNSWDPLMWVGRYEEATERLKKAMTLYPFGPSEGDWINLAYGLARTGHFDEARVANRHQTGIFRDPIRIAIEIHACCFAAAESIATLREADPQWNADYPGVGSFYLATIHFARGALRASSAALARSDEVARAASDAANPEICSRTRIEYACLTGGVFPMPSDTWVRDTSLTALVSRGLRATYVGDIPVAGRCLAVVRARPARNLVWQGAGPVLLEARIALLQGNPQEAVRLLRPWSLLRMETGAPPFGVGLTWVRWTLADAFERLAQPDSAAVHLERSVTVGIEETPLWPVIHHRLALLDARMGRVADAERHLAALQKLWDRPDPEIRRMLEQARTAVTAARNRSG